MATNFDHGIEVGAAGSEVTAIDSSGNLYQAGTLITATAAELNAAADQSAVVGTMSASTVMAATLGAYNVTTHRTGNIIKTTMYIDLTGAKSTTTDNDIIGDTGACHIGQVTTAVNGVIFKGQVNCAEVPTTGADDINLACASVATVRAMCAANCFSVRVVSTVGLITWPVATSRLAVKQSVPRRLYSNSRRSSCLAFISFVAAIRSNA